MTHQVEVHSIEEIDELPSGKFVRTLKLRDGFALGLTVSAVALASIGGSVATLGAWAAAALWAVMCSVALIQNHLFGEMAAMFPDKPGGITLYAQEGWKRYSRPVGAIAAWGYWMGWSLSLAVFGLTIGGLIQAQWFPHATWTFWDGAVHVGLPQLIAAAMIAATWLLNLFGVKPAVWTNRAVGAVLIVVFAIFIIGSVVTGSWSSSGLHWNLGTSGQAWGGWRLALTWMWLMGWTVYSTELSATFTPEFKDIRRGMWASIRSTGLFTLVVVSLLPIAAAGVIGEKAIAADPVGFYGLVFGVIVGSASGLIVAILCAALFISMSVGTADGSRALFGMAEDGLTLRQLHHLNRHHMPARAMTIDLIANLVLIFFVGNVLGVLFASNLGYFVAIFFALTGFLLLRRDRPDAQRPIRLGSWSVPTAIVLAVFTVILLVVGGLSPSLAGYGGHKEQLIGLGLMALGGVFYVIRRFVQDRNLPPATPATGSADGGGMREQSATSHV
jgi:amino acid transporter